MMPTPSEARVGMEKLYAAMQERQQAAFASLALLSVLVDFNIVPAHHLENAQRIVEQARAADKVLAES